LLKIHSDLFAVHRIALTSSAHYPEQLSMLEKMVIVLEDRRFMKHPGIDVIAGLRELGRALLFRKHGGASTIDMQFVRTATGYRKRVLSRKLYEILLSLIIQFRYNKIVILRSYLARGYFGTRLIGSENAAQEIFGAFADDLTLEQAAFVAAMLVYPRPRSGGDAWLSRVQRRASYGMRVYVRHKERFDQLPS
jgi:membrane peptidoglycan carboxypeptidase